MAYSRRLAARRNRATRFVGSKPRKPVSGPQIDPLSAIIEEGARFLHQRLLESKPTFEREEDFRAETEERWELRRQRIRQSARL